MDKKAKKRIKREVDFKSELEKGKYGKQIHTSHIFGYGMMSKPLKLKLWIERK